MRRKNTGYWNAFLNLDGYEAYQAVQGASLASLKVDIAQGMADVHAGRVASTDMGTIKARGRAALQGKAAD